VTIDFIFYLRQLFLYSYSQLSMPYCNSNCSLTVFCIKEYDDDDYDFDCSYNYCYSAVLAVNMIDSGWPSVRHSPVSCQNDSSYDQLIMWSSLRIVLWL